MSLPHPEPPQKHAFPVAGWVADQPIPALEEIPQERWAEALRLTGPRARQMAVSRVPPELTVEASMVEFEVTGAEIDRHRRARNGTAFPPPLPDGADELPAPRVAPIRPQINFRLTREQHARLSEAAELLGMKPGQLARLLTVRGVAQVLAERDRL